MKFLSVLTITSLLAAPAFAASEYENGIACGRKHPKLNTAIDNFANRRDASGNMLNNIVVPSAYAKAGALGGKAPQAKVWIEGTCNPPQWVPYQYIGPQFREMCAKGQKERRFGRNGCQVWKIRPGAGVL